MTAALASEPFSGVASEPFCDLKLRLLTIALIVETVFPISLLGWC